MTNPALAAVTVQNLPAPNKNTLQLMLETFHRLSGNAVSPCYRNMPRCTTVAPMQLFIVHSMSGLFLSSTPCFILRQGLSNAAACAIWCWKVQEMP